MRKLVDIILLSTYFIDKILSNKSHLLPLNHFLPCRDVNVELFGWQAWAFCQFEVQIIKSKLQSVGNLSTSY